MQVARVEMERGGGAKGEGCSKVIVEVAGQLMCICVSVYVCDWHTHNIPLRSTQMIQTAVLAAARLSCHSHNAPP